MKQEDSYIGQKVWVGPDKKERYICENHNPKGAGLSAIPNNKNSYFVLWEHIEPVQLDKTRSILVIDDNSPMFGEISSQYSKELQIITITQAKKMGLGVPFSKIPTIIKAGFEIPRTPSVIESAYEITRPIDAIKKHKR